MTEAQDRPLEVSQPKEYLTYLFFFFISTPLFYSPSQCTCFAPKGKDKPEVRSPAMPTDADSISVRQLC